MPKQTRGPAPSSATISGAGDGATLYAYHRAPVRESKLCDAVGRCVVRHNDLDSLGTMATATPRHCHALKQAWELAFFIVRRNHKRDSRRRRCHHWFTDALTTKLRNAPQRPTAVARARGWVCSLLETGSPPELVYARLLEKALTRRGADAPRRPGRRVLSGSRRPSVTG